MDFFEKMKGTVAGASQKLRAGVDHVVAEAGDKLQESRLRAKLKAIELEKQQKLLALGSKVYDLHRGEGIGLEDLSAELAELEQLDLQVAAGKLELDRFLTHAPEQNA